ncbi:MAG: MBL fold metallo-hydrolase [Candidatus Riflebacteria bacterium]|nr:MBL fold metallo-hydrolase [Candidatus Riflebacteria bacterium]
MSEMSDYGFVTRSFSTSFSKALLAILTTFGLLCWGAFLRHDAWGLLPEAFAPRLRIEFFDVGQGDSILVRTPRGRSYLIDGGADVSTEQAEAVKRVRIQDVLARRGIRHLDGIVVTSRHNDHLGGIIQVLRNFSVGRVFDSGDTFEGVTFADYQALLKQKRISRQRVSAGDRLDWGGELVVEAVSPAPEASSWPSACEDDRSIALMVRYGQSAIILSGELSQRGQREAARFGRGVEARVIKLPKHASADSLDQTFLDAVHPLYGIISLGRNNPFGYPASTTLELLEKRGIKLFRTDRNGTVVLTAGGHAPADFIFEVDRNL